MPLIAGYNDSEAYPKGDDEGAVEITRGPERPEAGEHH